MTTFLNLYHWFHFAERNSTPGTTKARISHDDALAHVDRLFSWAPESGDFERQQGAFEGHLARPLRRLDAMSMSLRPGGAAQLLCSRVLVDRGLGLPAEQKLRPHRGEDLNLAQSLIGVEGKTVLRAECQASSMVVWNRLKSPFAALFWSGLPGVSRPVVAGARSGRAGSSALSTRTR